MFPQSLIRLFFTIHGGIKLLDLYWTPDWFSLHLQTDMTK